MSRATEFVTQKIKDQTQRLTVPTKRPRILFVIKRIFDILFSFFGLLILWPLFLFVGLRIKKDSPGPMYYRGQRSGRQGRLFRIYKFRTMYETPESYQGAVVTAHDDKRVTKVGAWLRDSKLNELPQLWNILKGDMSFVGPRPENPEIVARWPEEIQNEILSMRPGLTSPASVTYRDEEKLLSSSSVLDDYLKNILPDKQRLDLLYVRYFSIAGDLDVIFMTLTLLLPGLRKKKISESAFFEGPLSYFLKKYVSWFFVDVVVAFLSVSLISLLWRAQAPLDIGFITMLVLAAILSFILAITNTLFGLKKINWRYASPTHVMDIALSTAVASFLFSLVVVNYYKISVPTPLLVEFGIFCFFGFVAVRYRERLITGIASRWIRWRTLTNAIGERVVVIGGGDCGQLAIWLLEKSNLSSAFTIVGIIDDDFSKVSQRINGYQVLGTVHDLPRIVMEMSIGIVMFAITKISVNDREKILKAVSGLPVKVIMIPDLLTVVSDYFMSQAKKAEDLNG